MSNYWEKKMDELERETKTPSLSYWDRKRAELENERKTTVRSTQKDDDEDDIAPIKPAKEEKSGGLLDFFQKGAFEGFDFGKRFDDGYQFGDIIKTYGDIRKLSDQVAVGTTADAGLSILKGIAGVGEGIGDLISYGVAGVADAVGEDSFARGVRQKAQENLFDNLLKPAEEHLDNTSILGGTSSAILEGVGQVATMMATGSIGASAGLSSGGVSALNTVITGLSSTGSGMSEAYQGGANNLQAFKHGLNSGAADALSELIFGGLGKSINAVGFSKGLSSADDMLAKLVGSKFKNQVARNIVEFGIKAGAEGLEEVLAGVAQAYSKYHNYLKDQGMDFIDVLKDENLLEQFVVGALTSGVVQAPGFSVNTDFITGMTQNEQAVVDKEVEKRIAEAEEDGTQLTAKEKNAIQTQVEKDLEKGYISTDLIEEVVGGETFKTYKSYLDEETSLQQEFDTLNQMKQGEMTGEQMDRRTELKELLAANKEKPKSQQLRMLLDQEVSEGINGSRLTESYKERARRGQAFEADLSKYDKKQKAVIQKAVENGILNNTNRTHEFVDMVAKISADKGVLFDFTNNEKLKNSAFAVDGKAVNGFVTKDGITINVQSSKALNTIVGHEVTHVLEGTDLYTELQNAVVEYAKAKGDYQGRFDSLSKLYEAVEGADINAELTADLVGDYLFTDPDFINILSTKHRNVFQRIYDEIMYLLKVATAGSKEARQFEKVKRAFEKAYREGENARESEEISDSETKYSIREEAPPKNTGVAYKVFFVKDGKLYPPMVANPGGADTPMGVWLNADMGTAAPPSKTGRAQVKAGGKGTQGGGGSLAFRPGWHLGDLPRASQFDRVNPETGKKELFPENFVWAEVEYAKDVDYQEEAMSYGYTDNGKFRHAYAGLPRLPENGYYRYRTNPKPDTVPWVITGAMKVNRLLSDAEVNAILEKNGVPPVHRQGGDVGLDKFGFNDDGTVKYSLSDSAGRQLSPEQQEFFKDSVVRDENGNLKVMYHGTSRGGHTMFDPYGKAKYGLFGLGSYFTDSKEVAQSYTKKGKGTSPQVYETYLNITNPMDMDAAADPKQWQNAFPEAHFPESGTNEQFYRAMEEYFEDNEYVRWEAEEAAMDAIMGMGYDGITHIGGGRFNKADDTRHRVYIAFQPEQIKDVGNQKPTSDPDIRYSLSQDSDGNKLTEEQERYFRSSKMRDDNGNLKVMYHGTTDGGFHTFDTDYSDDGTSLFFVDRNDVAESYSGTGETYAAQTFKTAEDFNRFFAGIGAEEYEVREKDGKFYLYEDGDEAAVSDSAAEIYEEFRDWSGLGYGNVNYKVYLDLVNPLEVDAQGKSWNELPGVKGDSEQYAYIQLVEVGDDGKVTIEYAMKGDPAPVTERVDLYEKFPYGLADTLSNMAPGEKLEGAYANPATTRDYAQYARENGHDGVIFKNIVDIGAYGGTNAESTVAIAFDGSQVKSVANQNPTTNKDIRYSLSDSNGKKLSAAQSEYFKDSRVRDENGNLMVMYHGTPNGDFTVFKDGTYFTDSKEYADRYQNPGASSISTGKTASSPKTFEVYLNIKKPFDIADAEARRIYIEDYIKGGNAMGINPYLSDAEYAKINAIDWTEGEDLRDFLIENEYDYDGLILDEGGTGGYGDEVQSRGKSYVVFSSEQVKSVDNRKPTADKDIRFSLSEAVEETRDLMALHNLTEAKLLKSLKLGGLPMPSVAIAKAQDGHSEFGEISLILPKEAIDPQTSGRNKLYSGDAWTPTYPKVEYKPNSKVLKQIEKKISGLVPSEVREFGGLELDIDNMTDTLNRYGGDVVDAFKDNDALKYAYLKEAGADIQLPMKEKSISYHGSRENGAIIKVAESIPADVIQNALSSGSDEIRKLEPAVRKAVEEYVRETYGDDQFILDTFAPAEGLSFSDLDGYLVEARKYLRTGVEKTVDTIPAREKIRDMTVQYSYEEWLRGLFSGIVEKEGIRNNADYFTPSGNRRSFEALHYEHNLENVIKAMREKGEKGIGFGGGSIFGAATTEFSSVEEMKQASGRLQNMSEEEYQEIKDGFSDRFFALAHSLPHNKNSFMATDDAANVLTEAVAKYSTRSGIANYLRRELKGWADYSPQVVDDLIKLVNEIRNMPTGYFEAKPQRAVSFDEVGVFVLPHNADFKLKQELLNRGYSIAEYDPKVEGDRQRVVNQFEELKFSLSDAGRASKPYGRYNVYGKDVLLETVPVQEEIAPTVSEMESVAPVAISETETTTEETAAPVIQESDLFPDDLASVQQELEYLQAEAADIQGAMEAMAAVGDVESVNRLIPELEDVQKKIAALQAEDAQRVATLDDADAPPEMEAPYQAESDPVSVENPFEERDWYEVSKRNVKAYMYENPEVKPFFQDEALGLITELNDTTRGERFYSEEAFMRGGNEIAWTGVRRHTSKSIETMLDSWHMSYADIEKGLNAIIEDHGEENIAAAKKIEFMLNDRLLNGYTDFYTKKRIPPNQEYIKLLEEKQITEYSKEAFEKFLATADQYAPPAQAEDIAPVKPGYVSTSGEQMKLPLYPDPNNVSPAMGEVQTDGDIAPVFEAPARKGVPEGQQAFMEDAGVPERITRKQLHANIVDNIKASFAEKGFDFDKVLKKAKNLSTFATVDNTPQRVMEKALGYKEGGILSDITVNQVAQNETRGIQWLNSFTDRRNGLLAQLSKRYGIKPGSKESAAAQMYAEGFYVGKNEEIIRYGDAELAADFPDVVKQAQIKGLARDKSIRQIYDDTLKAINESRTRNAYPEIPRLDNYFLHFRAQTDTFSRLGIPFNPNDIRAKDLPTDLNGVTADLKPGQPFFASAMHREGKRTSFDLLGGLEQYLASAKNQIYHIDDIQTLRALRNYVADTYGQANGLSDLDSLSEEEAQQRIEQVYNHLSTFAKFLNEEANVLAGKTALIDRGVEGIIGRRGMTFLDTLNRQVGANMVGYNVSSSLTNFLAPVQAFAKSNKAAFIKGMAQFAANKVQSIYGKGDGFAEQSPVMIRRKGADRFHRNLWQKLSDPGYVLMSAVDSVSTELIARAKYNELTGKGMSEQQAHIETDKWVSRLMGDRSLGQQPQLYNSKMLGILTKFQLEVRNQLDSQFYDTIQETKVSNEHIENALLRNAKTAAKVTSTFVQLAIVQHLFGKAFESIAGYNPAFDIISAIIKAFGWDDDEESEDTVLDNLEQGFFELMGDMPYVSTFTGGRIPISSALPIEELYKGEDQYGNEKSRWETLGEAAPYYLMPGGYGQLKKTLQGLDMFSDEHPIAGSYTDSGKLRFPVEDTLWNRVQAAVFGQWVSGNARDYFDNERNALTPEQTQELIDVGISIQDYWKYREGLSGLSTLEQKLYYIDSLNLTTAQKNVLANNLTDRKEAIDMTDFDEFDSLAEFDYANENPEKYAFFGKFGITYEQYQKADEDTRKAYDWAFKYPAKYQVSRAVSDDYMAFWQYMQELSEIDAKDENGETVNGLKKERVIEYINNLDMDYGQKIILYRLMYNSQADRDDYNSDILDYLNSRDDLTYEAKVVILEELDFTVTEDGDVYWE